MKRLLALAALVVAAAPAGAEAVVVCPGVGGTFATVVCVGANLNGSGNTVNPEVGTSCIVLGTPCRYMKPIEVGTTGIDSAGNVWVAGTVVL